MQLSRRKFLRGISMTGAAVQVGLPPLAAMFNMNGTAYAAEAGKVAGIDKRFLIWWNGNGIPERYWIPRETGENFELTACLSPLGRVRETLAILAEHVTVTPVFDDRLKEWSAGAWSGELYADLPQRWPDEWAAWTADRYNVRSPRGENFADLAARACAFIDAANRSPGERVAIVAHGFFNRALAEVLLGLSTVETMRIRQANDIIIRVVASDTRSQSRNRPRPVRHRALHRGRPLPPASRAAPITTCSAHSRAASRVAAGAAATGQTARQAPAVRKARSGWLVFRAPGPEPRRRLRAPHRAAHRRSATLSRPPVRAACSASTNTAPRPKRLP